MRATPREASASGGLACGNGGCPQPTQHPGSGERPDGAEGDGLVRPTGHGGAHRIHKRRAAGARSKAPGPGSSAPAQAAGGSPAGPACTDVPRLRAPSARRARRRAPGACGGGGGGSLQQCPAGGDVCGRGERRRSGCSRAQWAAAPARLPGAGQNLPRLRRTCWRSRRWICRPQLLQHSPARPARPRSCRRAASYSRRCAPLRRERRLLRSPRFARRAAQGPTRA